MSVADWAAVVALIIAVISLRYAAAAAWSVRAAGLTTLRLRVQDDWRRYLEAVWRCWRVADDLLLLPPADPGHSAARARYESALDQFNDVVVTTEVQVRPEEEADGYRYVLRHEAKSDPKAAADAAMHLVGLVLSSREDWEKRWEERIAKPQPKLSWRIFDRLKAWASTDHQPEYGGGLGGDTRTSEPPQETAAVVDTPIDIAWAQEPVAVVAPPATHPWDIAMRHLHLSFRSD